MRVIDRLLYLNAQAKPVRERGATYYREALTALMKTAPTHPEWSSGLVIMPAKRATHVEFFVVWWGNEFSTIHRIVASGYGDRVKVVASGWCELRIKELEAMVGEWLAQEVDDE